MKESRQRPTQTVIHSIRCFGHVRSARSLAVFSSLFIPVNHKIKTSKVDFSFIELNGGNCITTIIPSVLDVTGLFNNYMIYWLVSDQ